MTQDWTFAELDAWLIDQGVRISHMNQDEFRVWGVTLQEWVRGKRPRLLYGAGCAGTISAACQHALRDLRLRIKERDTPETYIPTLNLDLGELSL
jgi:hypothetical protein